MLWFYCISIFLFVLFYDLLVRWLRIRHTQSNNKLVVTVTDKRRYRCRCLKIERIESFHHPLFLVKTCCVVFIIVVHSPFRLISSCILSHTYTNTKILITFWCILEIMVIGGSYGIIEEFRIERIIHDDTTSHMPSSAVKSWSRWFLGRGNNE